MALKDTVKDPLNWVLLVLACAFAYYVVMIPYWNDLYLKTPQEMAMTEYLQNPSHPRPFMMRSLGAPPSSIEVVITDLEVTHIDSDSITLTAGGASIMGSTSSTPATPSTGAGAGAPDAGAADAGAADTDAADADAADAGDQDEEAPDAGQVTLTFGPEQEPPGNEILVAGDNMDLLELSVGQTISLQAHGLYETPLGWVPQEPELDQDQEEQFSKEELDELEQMKILAGGQSIRVPYREVGEFRFADGTHSQGTPTTLTTLSNDTDYIQTVNNQAGAPVDIYDVRLVERRQEALAFYFTIEDGEGRRARVDFNQRLLSEWYWALDRLQGQQVVLRGILQSLTPSDLRTLEADGNIQAVLDGLDILSPDGAIVINLENPAGTGLGLPGGS